MSDAQLRDIEQGAAPGATPQGIVLDAELVGRANLLLVGNDRSNAALARLAPRLPIAFGDGRLELAGKAFRGESLACVAVFPHPDGRRYVGVLGGGAPDAICWGSHLNLMLLPDYVVFDRARVVEWGFWSAGWR